MGTGEGVLFAEILSSGLLIGLFLSAGCAALSSGCACLRSFRESGGGGARRAKRLCKRSLLIYMKQ